MLQCNVSHVAWLCCYFILVTLLACCHVSRYEKFMLHSHVSLLPFTSNSSMKQTELRMLHMYVSVTMAWWDRWCICLWNEMHFCGSQTPMVLQWRRYTEVDDEGTFSKIFGEGIVGVVLVDDEGTPRLTTRVTSPKYLEKVLLVSSLLLTKVSQGWWWRCLLQNIWGRYCWFGWTSCFVSFFLLGKEFPL